MLAAAGDIGLYVNIFRWLCLPTQRDYQGIWIIPKYQTDLPQKFESDSANEQISLRLGNIEPKVWVRTGVVPLSTFPIVEWYDFLVDFDLFSGSPSSLVCGNDDGDDRKRLHLSSLYIKFPVGIPSIPIFWPMRSMATNLAGLGWRTKIWPPIKD